MSVGITAAEMNSRNREFWAAEQTRFEGRMSDETLREIALAQLAAEHAKGLPLYFRTSIYEALGTAEQIRRLILREQSQKGGRAKKLDTLQEFIEEKVRSNPVIGTRELESIIRNHRALDPIVDIDDDVISFKNHDGGMKEAKISGLKDLITRARRKIRRS